MKNVGELPERERTLLCELRSRIQEEFPNWSFRMTLFGSRARGDAKPDSDMDVLVEIDSDCISFEEKRRIRRLAGKLSMDSRIVLSLLIADRRVIDERGDFSIFRNIHEEGLAM